MSQIPRRTSELQATSVKKSVNPRPSRLTQASSSTALRLPRFSATPMKTPSRTPNRSASKDRASCVPMTAEKEKAPVDDKQFMHGKTMQVLDELARVDGFTELVHKGLKSMTHKQFIAILQHFLAPIFGSLKFDGNNYIEYVYNFVQSMDYPYTINKSSLKTPSAPHCQNSIIILLAWLSEFTHKTSEDETLIVFGGSEDYDDPEISSQFMDKTSEAFVLWNNQQEADAEEVMRAITDMYIQKTVGNACDIDAEINRHRKEIEHLKRDNKPSSHGNENKEKQEEMKQLSMKIEELRMATVELTEKVDSLRIANEAKVVEEAKAKKEFDTLHLKIKRQKITRDEKIRLLTEISQSKSVLNAKKQDAMVLSETNSKKEIKLSNLIQKKYALIGKLNNALYLIPSELQFAKIANDFDPTSFEIKTTKITDAAVLEGEFEKLKRGLMKLKQKFDFAVENITKQINHSKADLPTVLSQKRLLTENLQKVKAVVEELQLAEEKLSKELSQRDKNNENLIITLDTEIKQTNEEIKNCKYNISRFIDLNAQHAANKSAFKEKSMEKIKNLYEKRKKEVQEKRQRVDEMKRVIEDFEKRQKPLPENVQRTVDAVMAKRAAEN